MKNELKLSPSIMCADPLQLMRNIVALVKLDIDSIHMDIMDGNFVDNLALNIRIIRETRHLTRIPFDVHLMVQQPSRYFNDLIECGVETVIFHVETKEDIFANIEYLKSKNIKVGLALKIETPISALEKYLPNINYVLLMNTMTGYQGLKFNETSYDKIANLYSILKSKKYDIQLISDGGIKLNHVKKLYECGIDIFVAGTSLLFNNNGFSNNIENFMQIKPDYEKRKLIEKYPPQGDTIYNAAILKQINNLEVVKKSLRPLKKDEVVVKIVSCGVCGSDLSRVYKNGMYINGTVPGHEFSGVIIKTNDEDKHLLDKRVTVYPLIPCKRCDYCQNGKYNLCINYDYLGSRCDGGFADIVIVPKENIIDLPENISFNDACLIEPMSIVNNGLGKLPSIANQDILVLGLGSIGILAGMLCKKMGANTTCGIDRNIYKHEIAENIGFGKCYSNFDQVGDKKFHVMIDCSGSGELINSGINHLEKEANVLLIANHEEDLNLSRKTISDMLRGEMKLHCCWNSNFDANKNDWKTCIDYISKDSMPVNQLITHTFKLSDIKSVFEKIKNKEIDSLKVIINPD